MEEQVKRLVNRVWEKFQQTSLDQRFMVAISGIPGSGKTTLSIRLVVALNSLASSSSPSEIAAFVPMDGYHYPRSYLSSLPDPVHAHARRGAEFTFDGPAFLDLVRCLRAPLILPPSTSQTGTSQPTLTIHAPSFSHSLKDPVPNSIPIHPTHRIVVFEGLYLSLNRSPWRDAAALMDELWFVQVDWEIARRRLVARHVRAGIARDEKEAEKRADENDLANADEIVRDRLPGITELVDSREDGGWVHD